MMLKDGGSNAWSIGGPVAKTAINFDTESNIFDAKSDINFNLNELLALKDDGPRVFRKRLTTKNRPNRHKLSSLNIITLVPKGVDGPTIKGLVVRKGVDGPGLVQARGPLMDHCLSDGKEGNYTFSVQGRTKGLVWTKRVAQAHPIRMGQGPPGWTVPYVRCYYG